MTSRSRFDPVRELLAEGLAARAFPGVVLETGSHRGVTWREAAGRLTYADDAPAAAEDTIYDLASLTKVIATTSVAMQHTGAGALSLSMKVSALMPSWRGSDRAGVTVRDLLEHCSGLPGWVPLFRDRSGRAAFEEAIAALPLEYPPWTRSVYSDPGFIALGFILEDAGGRSLAGQLERLAIPELAFTPDPALRGRIAPTEQDPVRGRLLVGEVHDENAWALGGVAGHAGLFGTADAVGAFARLVLRTFTAETVLGPPEVLRRFVTRSTVPGSSRALGWDTMLPTSSCGRLLSPRAIGHVGFTGTSLWIDPEQDLYIVLLTNRVHPSRENEGLRGLRPAIHDAVVLALG